MTSEEATRETVEINVFADGNWHMKVLGVPIASAPKRLRELRAALEAQGFAPAARVHVSDEPAALVCPEHGAARVKQSKFKPGEYFCGARSGDKYCTWTSGKEPTPLPVRVAR